MKTKFFLFFTLLSVFIFAQENAESAPADSVAVFDYSLVKSFTLSDVGSDDGTALKIKWECTDNPENK
ncbi:TPA: hypothetical protein DCW38_05390, partial [candidate division WOR-3 bacterium]|nr:hypothetical protein [candidate division WOR-3 bacterium]